MNASTTTPPVLVMVAQPTKHPLASKTIWFAIVNFLICIFAAAGTLPPGIVSAQYQPLVAWGCGVNGAITVALRSVTSQPLGFTNNG